MTDRRICQRCAKQFINEPWRAGCDRCGGLCVRLTDESLGRALHRAYADGWRHGIRYTPSGHRSKAVL